jgi:hypothetical protein
VTARAYTGPWPIRSHRTLADLPPPPEPKTAAFEVLPPVYLGELPPIEAPRSPAGFPIAYALIIGFMAAYLALMLIEVAGR